MPFKDPEERKAYQRRYYSERYRVKHRAQLQRRRERLAAWFRELKSTLSCTKCGESHPATLQFHHLNGKDKTMNVSYIVTGGWGKKRILEEIAKCKVLCANCHSIHHWSGH